LLLKLVKNSCLKLTSPPAGIRDIATVTIRAPRLAENTNRTQKTEKNYADVAACKFFARHPKSI
jgi:hypothetical protein